MLCPSCEHPSRKAFIHESDGKALCFHCGWRAGGWKALVRSVEDLPDDAALASWFDKHKDELIRTLFKGDKVEISRFKGLGEMMAQQLKETTMDRSRRTLLRVVLVDKEKKPTQKTVERLMGTKAEARFEFIQENAQFAKDDVDV